MPISGIWLRKFFSIPAVKVLLALPVLIECAHLPDPRFQEQCIYAVHNILQRNVTEADIQWDDLIPELMGFLKVTNGHSYHYVIRTLGFCGEHARPAVPELLVLAKNGDQSERAIEALSGILFPARKNDFYAQEFIDLFN